jgi:hypothetical protein
MPQAASKVTTAMHSALRQQSFINTLPLPTQRTGRNGFVHLNNRIADDAPSACRQPCYLMIRWTGRPEALRPHLAAGLSTTRLEVDRATNELTNCRNFADDMTEILQDQIMSNRFGTFVLATLDALNYWMVLLPEEESTLCAPAVLYAVIANWCRDTRGIPRDSSARCHRHSEWMQAVIIAHA